jgi:mRNA interferase RelE/StbE
MATVLLKRGAKEDVANADGSAMPAILAGLKKLAVSPQLRGNPLGGALHGFRKLVVGSRNLRIVYRYFETEDVVWIYVIGARRDLEVYKIAESRIQDTD